MFNFKIPLPSPWRGLVLFMLSVWIAVGIFLFLLFNFIKPSFQTTFWQTMGNNLQSQSLALKAQTTVDLKGEKDFLLQSQTVNVDFVSSTNADLNLTTLLSHFKLPYTNAALSTEYEEYGFKQNPSDDWINQRVLNFNNEIYLKQRRYTRSQLNNWSDFIEELNQFHIVKYDNKWYQKDIDQTSIINYLTTYLALNTGVFFGDLSPPLKAEMIDKLKQAYNIDFAKARSLWQNNRLYYEYTIDLDNQAFYEAFIYYHNLHVPAENMITVETLNNSIFALGKYKIKIDVWAKKITQIEYLLVDQKTLPYPFEESGFVVVPFYSHLIGFFQSQQSPDLKTVVKFYNQNQIALIELPEKFINLNPSSQSIQSILRPWLI